MTYTEERGRAAILWMELMCSELERNTFTGLPKGLLLESAKRRADELLAQAGGAA